MAKNVLGVFVTFIASVMLMVDVPVKANDPMTKEGAMTQPVKVHGAATTMSQLELRDAMRMLWEEHIVYTRNFIISSLADLEDAGPVAERLLRNQDDIGNAIMPVYGEEAGKKLSALLRDHILITADIVKAARAGDNDGAGKGQERWKENADEIAVFLNGANPKRWPVPTIKDMLYQHLDYTTAEVVSRLNKDWAADIQAYDKGHAHMMLFADALTDGILKQHPAKFRKKPTEHRRGTDTADRPGCWRIAPGPTAEAGSAARAVGSNLFCWCCS